MNERQKRVLIVDDEEDLTWTLSKKLSKDSDKFELVCVNSGREAIDILNQLPFNLVITDVRMPEVSGLDLLVSIKESYPGTKVVIMTAYGSSDVQNEANDRGCFNYIEKPFEINELRQLILDALEPKKGFKGSVADFQLSDIIQLNCLGRLTSALKVTGENDEGIIFFQEGNIVHAETGALNGEAAFYYIMSWQGGEFAVLRNQSAIKETITRGWQSLLLESLRRVDENSDFAKEEAEREKRKRLRKVKQLLSKLYKSEGVIHLLLHSKTGFPLFYEGSLSDKPEAVTDLGNDVAAFLKNAEKKTQFLNENKISFGEFQFSKHLFLIQQIPGHDAYLSIIGKNKANAGFLRLEMKKNIPNLTKLL